MTVPFAGDRLVGEVVKNTRETIRVSLGEFKGVKTFSARVWAGKDGEAVPTKSGITANVNALPALVRLLTDAEREARAAGLIGGQP